MLNQKYCPNCHNAIDESRLNQPLVICNHCDTVVSETPASISMTAAAPLLSSKRKKTTDVFFLFLSLFLIAGLLGTAYYSTIWGTHAFQAFTFNVKKNFGLASVQDYKTQAAISEERKLFTQALDHREIVFQKDNTDLENLKLYGHLLTRKQNLSQAFTVYNQYFSQGGDDLKATYNFARILHERNEIELADEFYNKIFASTPDKFQVTASQSYVHFLVDTNQKEKAVAFIKNIREKTENSPSFMDSVYKKLTQKATVL